MIFDDLTSVKKKSVERWGGDDFLRKYTPLQIWQSKCTVIELFSGLYISPCSLSSGCTQEFKTCNLEFPGGRDHPD